jgi:WhiB family transcriptional regulator, redox-sensing transcriptional regulator
MDTTTASTRTRYRHTARTPARTSAAAHPEHRPHEGEDKEARAMQLTELIDRSEQATMRGASIPCRENDAELWFAETPDGVEFAKALCRTCPAIAQCLAGALDRAEPWGVWGGQLFVQGVVVARKRPRGRPRKNPLAA